MKKNIAIIGTVGVPANYGGFETLTENLINHPDFKFTVYCSSKAYKQKKHRHKNADLVYIPIKANGFQSIIYDCMCIFHAVRHQHKNLLVLGTSGALALQILKIFKKDIQVFTNIDGMEWKREKWGYLAKNILRYFEYLCIKNSDAIICDNQAICDYVQEQYQLSGQLIAYGGEHALTKNTPPSDDGYFLSICRIEPENHIHSILEAFTLRQEPLKIIGNWDHSKYGKALKKRYQDHPHIRLMDPVYDLHTLYDIRNRCTAYIHGHSAGGTNPSLVEIMHFGKPVLAFDCIYNRHTLRNQGCYFHDTASLVNALHHKQFLVQNVQEIQHTAQQHYIWPVIAQKYADLFHRVN